MSARRLAKDVSHYSGLLHARGWVANHDGNVSARLEGSERFLITPTAVSKRSCPPESIVECGAEGRPVSRGRPPSEVALHVGVYRSRPEVQAVLHAHPPYASAFALARRPLDPVCMPEVLVSLGEHIPMMPMVLPKDPSAADQAQATMAYADVALMAGNGVLAVGPDLETAYLRLEVLEHYCHITSLALSGIGSPAPLDAQQREYLIGLRKKAGLHREGPVPSSAEASTPLRQVVAEEVRRALGDITLRFHGYSSHQN